MKQRTFAFMYQDEYKKIMNNLPGKIDELLTLQQYDSKEERITETTNQIVDSTFQEMRQFVKNEKTRLTTQMNQVVNSYKKTRNKYDNPQKELLRRQDFDLELANMNEAQLKDKLNDFSMEFTAYEINKIMSLDWRDDSIKARAKSLLSAINEPYTKDVLYQEAVSELAQLDLIDSSSIRDMLLYVPSENTLGYTTIKLDNIKLFSENEHEIKEFQNKINAGINELDTLKRVGTSITGSDRLEEVHENEMSKKYAYSDFDSRAIPNSPEYDIYDRFKYLKERYNDEKTNRFDPLRDDYDITPHLKWLEAQHEKRLQQDEEFAQQYAKAVEEATNEESESEE